MTEEQKLKTRMEMSRDFKQGFEAGRANAFLEVDKKMSDLYIKKCNEYGVECIEGYADAYFDLKEWLKEQENE